MPPKVQQPAPTPKSESPATTPTPAPKSSSSASSDIDKILEGISKIKSGETKVAGGYNLEISAMANPFTPIKTETKESFEKVFVAFIKARVAAGVIEKETATTASKYVLDALESGSISAGQINSVMQNIIAANGLTVSSYKCDPADSYSRHRDDGTWTSTPVRAVYNVMSPDDVQLSNNMMCIPGAYDDNPMRSRLGKLNVKAATASEYKSEFNVNWAKVFIPRNVYEKVLAVTGTKRFGSDATRKVNLSGNIVMTLAEIASGKNDGVSMPTSPLLAFYPGYKRTSQVEYKNGLDKWRNENSGRVDSDKDLDESSYRTKAMLNNFVGTRSGGAYGQRSLMTKKTADNKHAVGLLTLGFKKVEHRNTTGQVDSYVKVTLYGFCKLGSESILPERANNAY